MKSTVLQQTKIDRYTTVSTVHVDGRDYSHYETAIIHHIWHSTNGGKKRRLSDYHEEVESYQTEEAARAGHESWVQQQSAEKSQ